jgi:hypothetical protein
MVFFTEGSLKNFINNNIVNTSRCFSECGADLVETYITESEYIQITK